jgi:YidC/Oxa1 family membrane protein insertase
MGQQFYVIRNNPAPGTPAFAAKQERDKAKAAKHPEKYASYEPAPEGAEVEEPDRRPTQRVQPKRQTRSQRKSGKPGTGTNPNKGGSK